MFDRVRLTVRSVYGVINGATSIELIENVGSIVRNGGFELAVAPEFATFNAESGRGEAPAGGFGAFAWTVAGTATCSRFATPSRPRRPRARSAWTSAAGGRRRVPGPAPRRGDLYRLRFALSGNLRRSRRKRGERLLGRLVDDLVVDTRSFSRTYTPWTYHDYSLVAPADVVRLEFRSGTSEPGGALLDDVSLFRAGRPSDTQTCEARTEGACVCNWEELTPWSRIECSTRCGDGRKTRTSECRVKMPGATCTGRRARRRRRVRARRVVRGPETSCADYSGCSYEWVAGVGAGHVPRRGRRRGAGKTLPGRVPADVRGEHDGGRSVPPEGRAGTPAPPRRAAKLVADLGPVPDEAARGGGAAENSKLGAATRRSASRQSASVDSCGLKRPLEQKSCANFEECSTRWEAPSGRRARRAAGRRRRRARATAGAPTASTTPTRASARTRGCRSPRRGRRAPATSATTCGTSDNERHALYGPGRCADAFSWRPSRRRSTRQPASAKGAAVGPGAAGGATLGCARGCLAVDACRFYAFRAEEGACALFAGAARRPLSPPSGSDAGTAGTRSGAGSALEAAAGFRRTSTGPGAARSAAWRGATRSTASVSSAGASPGGEFAGRAARATACSWTLRCLAGVGLPRRGGARLLGRVQGGARVRAGRLPAVDGNVRAAEPPHRGLRARRGLRVARVLRGRLRGDDPAGCEEVLCRAPPALDATDADDPARGARGPGGLRLPRAVPRGRSRSRTWCGGCLGGLQNEVGSPSEECSRACATMVLETHAEVMCEPDFGGDGPERLRRCASGALDSEGFARAPADAQYVESVGSASAECGDIASTWAATRCPARAPARAFARFAREPDRGARSMYNLCVRSKLGTAGDDAEACLGETGLAFPTCCLDQSGGGTRTNERGSPARAAHRLVPRLRGSAWAARGRARGGGSAGRWR